MMGVAQDALPLKASQLRYRVRYSSNKCLVFEKCSLFQAFSHQFKRSAMVNDAFVVVERKQRKVWVFSASLLPSRCMLVHSTLLTERLEQPTGSFVFFKMFLFVSCLCAFYSLFFIFFSSFVCFVCWCCFGHSLSLFGCLKLPSKCVKSKSCQCTQSLQLDNCFSVGVCLNHSEMFDQTICIFIEQTFSFKSVLLIPTASTNAFHSTDIFSFFTLSCFHR